MKASEAYLIAAQAIDAKELCFCCVAIPGRRLRVRFAKLFEPPGETSGAWFGQCQCTTDDNIGVRVIALLLMAAIAKRAERAGRRRRK